MFSGLQDQKHSAVEQEKVLRCSGSGSGERTHDSVQSEDQ